MKSLYSKLGGCVVLVLLSFVGVVVFWPGGSSEPVDRDAGEAVEVKADSEAKRPSTPRPSIREIDRVRPRHKDLIGRRFGTLPRY